MTIFNTRRKGMAKGQFNIKIDLPLIFWMIALLAAHKPLLLLDFHRSFNDTRTMRSVLIGSEYPTKDTPHFLLSKLGQHRFRRTAAAPGCTGALPCAG